MGKSYTCDDGTYVGQLELGDTITDGLGRWWMMVPAVLGATCAFWKRDNFKLVTPLIVRDGAKGTGHLIHGHLIHSGKHTIEPVHLKTPHYMLVELGKPFLRFEMQGKKLALIARKDGGDKTHAYYGMELTERNSLFGGTPAADYFTALSFVVGRVKEAKRSTYSGDNLILLVDDFTSDKERIEGELAALHATNGELTTKGGMPRELSLAWSAAVSARLKVLEAGPPRDYGYSSKPKLGAQSTIAEDHEGIDVGFRR